MAASPLKAPDPPERPLDLATETARARETLGHALAADAAGDAISLVVLAGLVRLYEFALIVAIGVAVYAGYVGFDDNRWYYVAAIAAVGAAAVIAFQSFHGYALVALRNPHGLALRLAGAWAVSFLLLFAAAFFFKLGSEVSRGFATLWFLIGLGALGVSRLALARMIDGLVAKGRIVKRAVVVGGGDLGRGFIRELTAADASEVQLLGVFDDRTDKRATLDVEGLPKLGTVDDLLEFARTTRLDLVIFALPITAEERIQDMLRKLWVLPIDIRLAAHANRLRFRPRSYSYLGPVPMLDLFDRPIADWDVIIKLAFDKLVGAFALVALSPILALTALAVKLDSPGPVLFKQKRHGFNNELIEVFKFRSMYVDQQDASGAKLVTRGDPRVTRVGRFIRRTSIDELPQLFNVVLKGNLSLVGPRPHAVHALAANVKYDEAVDGYFARHRVKPGITGWAQINGWRGETDTEEKIQARVECDLYYIEHWSIWLDVYILAMTPMSLIKTKNAY